jgi:hypothetical protein
MGTAENFLATIGPDEWEARVYGALSAASSLRIAVRSRANALRLAYNLHTINKRLAKMFSNVYDTLEGKQLVVPDVEPVTPRRLQDISDSLKRLAQMIEYLYEQSNRVDLTNNSLTAGSLHAMRKRVDEINDLADWFETAAQSNEVNSIFARANEEKDRGELFDLSQV